MNKKSIHLEFTKARLVLFILLAFLLLTSLLFSKRIETFINVGYSQDNAVLDELGLQVHFVNVGQGDSTIIEFPDGKTMIIDAGPSGNADNLLDYINNNIFEDSQMPVFDYMILTHSDTDHVGGADEILDNYQVNNIYRPEIYATYDSLETAPENRVSVSTQTYATVIEKVLGEPNCTVIFNISGLTITGGSGLDSYIITFYSPNEHYYSDVNEFSPIMVLQYRERAIMLTGDATSENELTVVTNYDLPQIDVLKLGHHGSYTSTSSELLSEINLTYAIISVGEDNSYGHPSEETLNRLLYSGISENETFLTSENGNIIANVNINGEVNIFTQVESLPTYIEWEYIVSTGIVILFFLLFKQETKKSKKK